ncbi:MAG TPA: nucleotidyltransferase domain-containing protein [Longimicrobium sp.]
MLTNVLDAVLGSTAKVKILRALLPLTSAVSGREAKLLSGVRSQGGALQALTELAQLGVLHEERIRGARLYRVNRAHHVTAALSALFQIEGQRLSSLRALIENHTAAKGLIKRVQAVILFGSAARGDARPGSDLDLFVVADSTRGTARLRDALDDVAQEAARTLGLNISALVMPNVQLRRRWRAGDPLLRNIEAEGRVLLGASLPELTEDR